MRNLPAQTTEYGPGGSQSVLEQLLARIASGDREALGQLYHRTRSAVYALTLSYTKNAQDAEDLMQDTFVRVWDSAGQYRGRGSAMGWLLAIARNLALMKLREREQQGSLDEDEWNALPAQSSSLTPEDRLLAQNALSTLDDQERRVVLLHAVAGLKHRETAALLDLPLATVLSKYHRTLKKLRIQIEGDDAQ